VDPETDGNMRNVRLQLSSSGKIAGKAAGEIGIEFALVHARRLLGTALGTRV
jgi:hypothetical protein